VSKTITDSALLQISIPPPPINFTSLTFSNNGYYLLVGTSSDTHYLLCAFYLTPLLRLRGHRALGEASSEEVSFTGDSRYVVSGSADGAVYFWDLGTEKIEAEKRPDGTAVEAPLRNASVVVQGSGAQGQRGGSRAVRFSPRLCVLAVGGDELVGRCTFSFDGVTSS
jgi:COMPASS component SWD2